LAALFDDESRVVGAARYWIDAGGGDFELTSNWSATSGGASGASVPGSADSATFDLNATYTVGVISNPTLSIINVDRGTVTLDIFGSMVATSGAAALTVGGAQGLTGRLTLLDGTLRSDTAGDDFVVGDFKGTGFLTIEDGASLGTSTATTQPKLSIGKDGAGTLTARGRSDLFVTEFDVATFNASQGDVTLTGPLTQLTSGPGRIGAAGDGSLTVNSGAHATFAGELALGVSDSGLGEVDVAGTSSRISAASLIVGGAGFGKLDVSSGASLGSSGVIELGDQAGAYGELNITGSGSSLSAGDNVVIGGSGEGLATVASGATVNVGGTLTLGAGLAPSAGRLTITGAGSEWNNVGAITLGGSTASFGQITVAAGGLLKASSVAQASLASASVIVTGANSRADVSGNFSVGNLTPGFLEVVAGGVLDVGGAFTASIPGSVVSIDGGSVYIAGSFLNSSTLNLVDGLLSVRGSFQPRSTAGAFGINGVAVDDLPVLELFGNAATTNVTTLTVGDNRRGRLVVRDSRIINLGSNAINVGALPGGEGSLAVSGGGSLGTGAAGSLNVGGAGGTPGGGGVVDIQQGGFIDVGTLRLHSGGTINLDGGSLTFDALGPLAGRLNWNSGVVRFDSSTTLTSFLASAFLGDQRTLRPGQTLISPQVLSVGSPLTIDGGTLDAATLNVLGGAGVSPGSLEVRAGVVQAGAINNTGLIHLNGPQARIATGTLANSGTLRGTGLLAAVINNAVDGQVQVAAGERQRWAASNTAHVNSGHVSVIGGEWQVDSTLQNAAGTGLISARDAILRLTGVINNGSLAFSNGTVDVYGDVTQNPGGRITISAGGIANFYDDVVLAGGANVQASALGATVSKAVFFGAYNGGLSGGGQMFMEGDHRPGASPGLATVDGDLFYGPFSTLTIDLGGLVAGSQHDQVLVSGDLALSGSLIVQPWNDFELAPNQQFVIADVAGNLVGQFDGLAEGALVGNFTGRDLFITYAAGDGNDVALFTAPSFTADFDGDGDVDGDDLANRWTPSLGVDDGADADGDGDSDGFDFLAWQRQFGSGQQAAAVPEPQPSVLWATLTLLGPAAACRRSRIGTDQRRDFAQELSNYA